MEKNKEPIFPRELVKNRKEKKQENIRLKKKVGFCCQ